LCQQLTRFNVPNRIAVADTASDSESVGDNNATSIGIVVPGNRTNTVVIVSEFE
jgi:hypothetical protein